MSQTRIEQLIDEIYNFVDGCKSYALNSGKILVPKDQLLDLVDELKRRTPDEIKRYQKIIANRDNVVAQAEERAKQIIDEANQKAQQLINETTIMQQAYAQANEMVTNARNEAEELRRTTREQSERLRIGVLSYADDMLQEVTSIIDSSYRDTIARSDALIASLKDKLDIIETNRKEITEQLNEGNLIGDMEEAASQNYSEDEYDFPADTFIKNID